MKKARPNTLKYEAIRDYKELMHTLDYSSEREVYLEYHTEEKEKIDIRPVWLRYACIRHNLDWGTFIRRDSRHDGRKIIAIRAYHNCGRNIRGCCHNCNECKEVWK